MLKTKEVEVVLGSINIKHYEEKGYVISRVKRPNGKMQVERNTKIIVNVNDLPDKCKQEVEYVCDYCAEEEIHEVIQTSWGNYNNHKKDIINKDACMKHSMQKAIEMGTTNFIQKKIISKEEIAKYYLELANRLKCIPKTKHINAESKVNPDFPTISIIYNAFGTINDLKKYCNLDIIYFKYTPLQLIESLTEYIKINGIPSSIIKTFKKKNNLSSYKTYVFHFGNDFSNLIKLCGFELTESEEHDIRTRGKANTLSKEEVILMIKNMQNKLDRPLISHDFDNPEDNEIGITTIKKYWGSINVMKEELGFTITHKNLKELSRPLEQLKEDIIILCNKIQNEEHRTTISKDDIDNCDFTMSYSTYNKIFHEQLNMSISDYIYSIGFKFLKAGNGMVYHYDDGEITSSQFEYVFTNYLRDINLKFNSDYNRGVRYNTFIDDYKGMMDCDYVITYKDRLIYVEIAGMLRDYKNSYYRDKPIINSKSKEEYRQKLMKKEDMFKESGVEYYILFPSDLNDETYRKIFN